jgi:hypothetical protein
MNARHALQFSFVPLMILALAASTAMADVTKLRHDGPSGLQHLPFLQALGITLAVELLIVFAYCRRRGIALARPLRVGVLANVLSLRWSGFS